MTELPVLRGILLIALQRIHLQDFTTGGPVHTTVHPHAVSLRVRSVTMYMTRHSVMHIGSVLIAKPIHIQPLHPLHVRVMPVMHMSIQLTPAQHALSVKPKTSRATLPALTAR